MTVTAGAIQLDALGRGINWDAWREDYWTLSFTDMRDFYVQVAELFPVQQSHDIEACCDAFEIIDGKDLCVVELGGWDGKLAASMLVGNDISEWHNYDIADVPQVTDQPGYFRTLLKDWMWARPIHGDVFVACHTIEHLSREHLEKLIGALRTDWVYLEAPLARRDHDWTGYPGSHKLEVGWDGVDELMAANGYLLGGYMVAEGILDEYGEQGLRAGLWRRK